MIWTCFAALGPGQLHQNNMRISAKTIMYFCKAKQFLCFVPHLQISDVVGISVWPLNL